MTMAAGALMTLAVMKCLAISIRSASSAPPSIEMYAAITLPAIVANPPTITHISCDSVMRAMNGRTVSGASVCPTKMFAEADIASTPVIPSARRRTDASSAMMRCITP